MTTRIRRWIETDTGHRVPNHKSKCCHLHGHRYRWEAEIEGDVVDVALTNFEIYLDGKDFFYPGMGSPLALMVNKAILGGLSKSFLNDRLTLQLRNLMDLEYKGYFLELNTDYKLTDRVTSTFAINYINGDETHPNSIKNKGEDYEKALDYPLNQMEDFSHIRMQIKYSF